MKKRAFAEGTTVSLEKTKAEIETLLNRYGATGFGSARQGFRNQVVFVAHGKQVRFELSMPDPKDKRFGSTWEPEARRLSKWEAECRRLWRCLLLAIKAKLEVVDSGIAQFEEEFMAHIVMPDGKTVGQHAMPGIEEAYLTGRVRGLLPEHTS